MRRNYTSIPVLVAIILIPQLLFWWLAPVRTITDLAVYGGGTVLTILIPAVYFLAYLKSGVRKTAGLAVVCGVLDLASIALSALLLGMHASLRSVVFAFVIATLVYVILLLPMIVSAVRTPRQGVYAVAPEAPVAPSAPDSPAYAGHTADVQPPVSTSAPPHRVPVGSKPLPPRNR